MEYLELGEMPKYLQKKSNSISEKNVNEVVLQVLECLGMMHEEGFSHRDLKPAASTTSASTKYPPALLISCPWAQEHSHQK